MHKVALNTRFTTIILFIYLHFYDLTPSGGIASQDLDKGKPNRVLLGGLFLKIPPRVSLVYPGILIIIRIK